MFQVTRLYSDTNGDSRFEEIGIQLHDKGKIGMLSDKMTTTGIIFRKVESTYDYDFHNSPQRQYLVILDGSIEIETSLGDKRIFKAGEVILLEDTTGKGHRTKNIEIAERRSLFIPC